MIVGATTQGPVKAPVSLADWRIIDAREAATHLAVVVKVPILVAVGTKPIAAVVMPLIGKTHRETVLPEGPELLDEPIVELALPLAGGEISGEARSAFGAGRLRLAATGKWAISCRIYVSSPKFSRTERVSDYHLPHA